MKIELGTLSGTRTPAMLDLEIVLRSNLLVQAASGGGKSWLLRRLAEQACAHVPVGIIDVEGEFATLREKHPFVLIGPGGETPADPRSAAVVATKMLELGVSFVADIFEMPKRLRPLWVKAFLEALIDAPKNLWRDMLLLLDEAHMFAPEGGHGAKENTIALDAVTDFAARGRKRGYGLVCATQRIGKFSKDTAAELKNVLIGQAMLDIDRARAAEALGTKGDKASIAAFYQSLKLMEPGTFFALGRALTFDPTKIAVGPVETTHPKPGRRTRTGPPPPLSKVKALLPQLKDLPQEAEKAAKTVDELQAQVRDLRAQLARQPQPKIVETMVAETIPKEFVARLADLARDLDELRVVTESPRKMALALTTEAQALTALARRHESATVRPAAAKIARGLNGEHKGTVPVNGGFHGALAAAASTAPLRLSGENGPTRILKALKMSHDGCLTKRAVGVFAGMKSTTGSFRTYLSQLRSSGYITSEGERLTITAAGREAAGNVPTYRTRDELLALWGPNIGKTPLEILQVLLSKGQPLDTEAIAKAVNDTYRGDAGETLSHTTGSFRTYMSTLVASGLVDRVRAGVFQPSEVWYGL